MAKENDWECMRILEQYVIKEIIPSKLFPYLYDCLTAQDKERIEADEKNHGAIHAASTLISCLRRRGKLAFPSFVTALRQAGYLHTALLLDPFYNVGPSCPEIKEDEGLAVSGRIADIGIVVTLTSCSEERCYEKETFIARFSLESKTDKAKELRKHFKLFYEETDERLMPVFVKTKCTQANPLVLVFRLSTSNAAKKLWDEFKSGKLKIMIEKRLKNFEQLKEIFVGEEVQMEVQIDEAWYNKALKTLNDPEHPVLVDGEEKKDLVLSKCQQKLALLALDGKNTIICARTGYGKTFVAMEVIKNHLLSPEGKKVVIFIVNTVSLVQQQQQRLEIYLPEGVNICSLCGNSSDLSLSDVLKSNHVVVLTAQVLVNALNESGNITMSDFSLLVFDECHHTKGNHPYNDIMKFYMKVKFENEDEKKSASLPQVLGLSASLGIGSKNEGHKVKAEQHMMDICANLDTHSLQTPEEDKQATSTSVLSIPRNETSAFVEDVSKVMGEIEEHLRSKINKTCASARGRQPYENWVVGLCNEDLGPESRDLTSCAEHLRDYNTALMICQELRTRDALSYLDNNIRSKGETEIEIWLDGLYKTTRATIMSRLGTEESHTTNPWLQRLEELLSKKFPVGNENSSRVIVFVRTRFVATALVDWMKKSEQLKDVIKPSYVIGCANGMTKAEQDNQIRKFREGQFNVIICTSVLLEGIDIQDCDYVIEYGMPGNEITHVQARGRVRSAGEFVIIVDPDKLQGKERDLRNEKLMKEVIAKIASMPTEEFKKQVNHLQKLTRAHDLSNALHTDSDQPKTSVVDGIALHCKKCRSVACNAKHVKVHSNVHHLVPNYAKTLGSIEVVDTEKQNLNKHLIKIGEILCGSCHQPWGIMVTNQHGQFPCVKITNFRVKGLDGGTEFVQFKKWKDFPYEFQPFDPAELENVEVDSNSV